MHLGTCHAGDHDHLCTVPGRGDVLLLSGDSQEYYYWDSLRAGVLLLLLPPRDGSALEVEGHYGVQLKMVVLGPAHRVAGAAHHHGCHRVSLWLAA